MYSENRSSAQKTSCQEEFSLKNKWKYGSVTRTKSQKNLGAERSPKLRGGRHRPFPEQPQNEMPNASRRAFVLQPHRFTATGELLDPRAFTDQWLSDSVGADTVDIHLRRSDHPVDVNQALVCSQRSQLCRVHLLPANQARGIRLA